MIQQKKALLNEKMLRKQNDLQINMLEQEIENRMMDSKADAEEQQNEFEKQKRELDAQIAKCQVDLEKDQAEL
jgi:hypothetical protein